MTDDTSHDAPDIEHTGGVASDYPAPQEDAHKQAVVNNFMQRRLHATPATAHEEDGGGQAWLLTYTDLVTLLLVLFVALLTVANLDPVTPPRDVSLEGMSRPTDPTPLAEFGVYGQDDGAAVVSSGGARESDLGEGTETLRRLRLYVRENGLRGDVDIFVADGFVQLSVRTPVTFDSSSAEVNLQGRELLLKLAPILARIEGAYTVMGGADDLATADDAPALVWGLAAARAVSVVDLLVAGGVDPNRVTVAARPTLQMPQGDTIGRAGVAGVVITIHQQDDGPEGVLVRP